MLQNIFASDGQTSYLKFHHIYAFTRKQNESNYCLTFFTHIDVLPNNSVMKRRTDLE